MADFSKSLLQFLKGISLVYITRLETFLEPMHALLGCSMCERVGNNMTLRLLLQTVIADRIRRA